MERFIRGGFSALILLMAIGLALIINMVVNAVPASYTKFDISAAKYYTFSEQTKEVIRELSDDVTLYFLTEPAAKDEMIFELLSRYELLSDKISLEVIDLILYPNFSKQFTERQLETNTVIVSGSATSRIVEYGDIYPLDYGLYLFNGTLEYDFDGEGQITSALLYATDKDPSNIYYLTGHGEAELSYTMRNMLEKQNFELNPINLVRDKAIPDDAGCLLIAAPGVDLTDDETEIILEYMGSGGNLLLITDYAETAKTNLDKILEYNGLALVEGIVFEGNANHFIRDHNNYLLPNKQFHDITMPLINGNLNVVTTNTQAVYQLPLRRSTLYMQPLLTSSADSYSKIAGYKLTTRNKEDGDIDGPFTLGIFVTDSGSGGESKFIWFGTSMLLDDEINGATAGANANLFINSLSHISDHYTSVGIHPKSMQDGKIILSASQSRFWSIALMIVLPSVIMLFGLFVWLKRRRR
jgi:ABC-2 type transport system permease protein